MTCTSYHKTRQVILTKTATHPDWYFHFGLVGDATAMANVPILAYGKPPPQTPQLFYRQICIYKYLDLPKGAKWLLKGVNSPSLRV